MLLPCTTIYCFFMCVRVVYSLFRSDDFLSGLMCPVEAFLENMLVNVMAKLDAMEKELKESKKELKESKKKYNESKKKFEAAKDLSDSEAMTDLERETEHAMHEAEVAMLKAELSVAKAELSVAKAELAVAKAERDLYRKHPGDDSSEYQTAVQQVGIALQKFNLALREVENATTARDQCQQRLAAAEGDLIAGTFSSSLLGVIFVCALCSSLYSSVSSIAARVSGGVMCL